MRYQNDELVGAALTTPNSAKETGHLALKMTLKVRHPLLYLWLTAACERHAVVLRCVHHLRLVTPASLTCWNWHRPISAMLRIVARLDLSQRPTGTGRIGRQSSLLGPLHHVGEVSYGPR